MTVPYKGGAPRKYEPEELTQAIIKYFEYMDIENKEHKEQGEKQRPFTISGLCNYLDIHMDTWCEYSKKQEYSDSIKKAKKCVEQYIEEGLLNGTLNPIGAIFNLKNNFGWVDKIDINTTNQPEQLTPSDIKSALEAKRKENKEAETVENA